MKLTTTWQGNALFEASDGAHKSSMDAKAPFGKDTALSPKQLCLAAITGCTGVDVVLLLKKTKKELRQFRIDADAPVTEGYPAIFREVQLDFHIEGDMSAEQAEEAVRLSQTKYCGVSAMIAKACPIHYRVHLNGALVNEGQAKF
jgi:putative redox protein